MSESVRQRFESWFALQHLRVTGNHLSIEEMQHLRGESDDYSKHAYMHGCWIGFCAANTIAGEHV
ncbi:hypothetical protein HK44_020555 [Pseudomonas fluorescens HK44]|uniref:Uncharacterized protein n=1 Tax=Pseudomonas fluorescens HK44 TaxID=1042209 RepID=A0A010S762_PSEFL|nr:hypothetical protein [Pseudomonas fluorescens]EXF96284.1 hypothetical protein HK44_020555 [Pseudomonas fluorescens HK44]